MRSPPGGAEGLRGGGEPAELSAWMGYGAPGAAGAAGRA